MPQQQRGTATALRGSNAVCRRPPSKMIKHTYTSYSRPLSPNSPSMSSSASFSIPFLLPLANDGDAARLRDSLCLCCSGDFNTLEKAPRLLHCGHSICSNCVTAAKSAGLQELNCSICSLGTNLGQTLNLNHNVLDALKKGYVFN